MITPFRRLALVLAALPALAAAGVSDDCRTDLDSIPAFMLENDAGGRDVWNREGAAHFDQALSEARAAVASVADEPACTVALRAYLRAWRPGHLGLRGAEPAKQASTRDDTPRVQWLSPQTALLTLPSFDPKLREAVEQLLAKNHAELARRPNWIIDVRGNGGGSDSVYASVLRWTGPLVAADTQVEYLSTAANIEATRQVCALFAPGDAECEKSMQNERERMQSVAPGSWVLQQAGDAYLTTRQPALEPKRPARVAILVDDACVSSCEQFLLDVRQSFSVKLVGQHSRGTLDYSNLRPHVLPSGRRTLMYAVTRTKRMPGMPVDGIGVMPDVYLPPEAVGVPADALVGRVREWLENKL